MPSPVSIIRWRDAKADPPTGDLRPIFVVQANGIMTKTHTRNPVIAAGRVTWWAELPVVGDLTDEHVQEVLRLAESSLSYRTGELADEDQAACDLLRAALGGKEEVDA